MPEPLRIRAEMENGVASIKVLMPHPEETGQRHDPKTKRLIPAHFIQNVTITVNGRAVLETEWGTGIAQNPTLGIRVRGPKAGDKVFVRWVDNLHQSNSIETVIKG